MASTMTMSRPSTGSKRDDRAPRRRKEARTDIWTGLLRQTRDAQARSRTLAVQTRELLVCGGSAEDQRAFVQTLARPAPPLPAARNNPRDLRDRRPRGEVVLSNRFAYGYGHLTLYSPPPQGASLLGSEGEEVAKVGVHTVPELDVRYEETLRRLLRPRMTAVDAEEGRGNRPGGEESGDSRAGSRPAVALLLSWKQPWKFLELLRAWLQLLSRALLRPDAPAEAPIDILTEHRISLTVVIQHVEFQEHLERENYKEETFDYISQCLRTCLLPLSAGLIYTPSAPLAPANAQTAPLSEVQKIIYTSLGLDLSTLSPALAKTAGSSGEAKKDEMLPKHNVVDRMAIVIPSSWDSVGKIRLLSESFSPEAVTEGWLADLSAPVFKPSSIRPGVVEQEESRKAQSAVEGEQPDAAAEQHTFESVGAGSPLEPSARERSASGSPPASHSTVAAYDIQIQDPQAHKAAQAPRIETTTKPEQEFLAEMRAQLQLLEEKDRERQKREPGAVATASTTSSGRGMAVPGGESSGALNSLGDVQFNVGGVNYNAATAEAAIERLRRPTPSDSPRVSTPRPPKREDREGSRDTPRTAEIDTDKLEEYFQSLMKRGGGGSAQSTPSKPSGSR